MKKLRFGVVGCGNRSGIMDYLIEIPEVEIVALTDVNAQAMQDTAERLRNSFGVAAVCYESYEALLEQSGIDAVLIMSPDFCH
ncbi:MAG: Gfo/Idh/MocA family oxidoreductase, partial [Victivallaceae bacterium]